MMTLSDGELASKSWRRHMSARLHWLGLFLHHSTLEGTTDATTMMLFYLLSRPVGWFSELCSLANGSIPERWIEKTRTSLCAPWCLPQRCYTCWGGIDRTIVTMRLTIAAFNTTCTKQSLQTLPDVPEGQLRQVGQLLHLDDGVIEGRLQTLGHHVC